MAKFVLVYRNGGGIPQTAEEQKVTMAAWGTWYGKLGAAVVDGGAPFGALKTVAPKASDGPANRLDGYTILSADSLAAAADMAKECPVLGRGGSIDIYEHIDMAM